MNFAPSSIAWRGKVARLRADVQAQKPEHGERTGTMRCICGASFRFTIEAGGRSRGQCTAGCTRWCE